MQLISYMLISNFQRYIFQYKSLSTFDQIQPVLIEKYTKIHNITVRTFIILFFYELMLLNKLLRNFVLKILFVSRITVKILQQ